MAVKPGAFVRTAVQKTQLQASSLCVAAGGCSLRHSLQWTPGLGWGGAKEIWGSERPAGGREKTRLWLVKEDRQVGLLDYGKKSYSRLFWSMLKS